MVPKDVVTAFDEITQAARGGAEEPPIAPFVVIAEGVVGALFSIAHSLEKIADTLNAIEMNHQQV